jgi:hypothetical protein
MVLVSRSWQMVEYYIKIRQNRLPSRSSQFTIHSPTAFRLDMTQANTIAPYIVGCYNLMYVVFDGRYMLRCLFNS